jgi:hypothetical protein
LVEDNPLKLKWKEQILESEELEKLVEGVRKGFVADLLNYQHLRKMEPEKYKKV